MLNTKCAKLTKWTLGTLCVCLIGSGITIAQTKQLKSPSAPPQVIAQNADQTSGGTQTIINTPDGNSSSYSVIIENKTTPDGKVVQSRKVWQNGQLVQEEEKTLDADEAQNSSATIQLPNGQIAPGGLFSSEDDDSFGTFGSGSPFESLRVIEEQMRQQQERMKAQFDALRQQLADPNGQFQNVPQRQFGAPILANQAPIQPSKYWIGATIETVPDFLVAQLPIEDKQGVWIQFVAPDSPAAKAGLKRYDVLYKIGDDIVTDPRQVSELIEKIGANKTTFEYYRKGKLEKGELTVEERPANAQNGFPFGATQSNKIRVVRPGLIVPSTEADASVENNSETVEEQPLPTDASETSDVTETQSNTTETPANAPEEQ